MPVILNRVSSIVVAYTVAILSPPESKMSPEAKNVAPRALCFRLPTCDDGPEYEGENECPCASEDKGLDNTGDAETGDADSSNKRDHPVRVRYCCE